MTLRMGEDVARHFHGHVTALTELHRVGRRVIRHPLLSHHDPERKPAGHSGAVHDCRFSPDGRRIVSASADRSVKIWDAQTGQELATLLEGIVPITGMCMAAPTSRIVASALRPKPRHVR